jgi:CRISPR-associated protein (TIGR03986 family)
MTTKQELSATATAVHAPYGFVPLSSHVFRPPWAGAVSQDVPFEDGINGVIDLEIHTEAPIFVRGATDKTAFFRGPAGYAIPGSGVRGAVRNVVEIASYGWMRRVNNHRYGVRDLHNQNVYVRHMAGVMTDLKGDSRPLPKVVAGWLQRGPDAAGDDPAATVAHIEPCDFAKVDYRLLIGLARQHGLNDYNPGARQSAVSKYRRWGLRDGRGYHSSALFQVRASVDPLRPPQAEWLHRGFGQVLGLGAGVDGRLVFTGQPSEWREGSAARRGGGHPKHHDFFFSTGAQPAPAPVPVSREVMDGFSFVHSDGAQQHSRNKGRSPNPEWAFWKAAYDAGERVPVFFLPDAHGGVRAFGLAMMFRLAYKNSVHDAIRNTQDPWRAGATDAAPTPPDLAELVFGHVPLARKGGGAEREPLLKGRVSFGLFAADPAAEPMAPVSAVLGTPKASYYPAYVEQSPTRPGARPPNKDAYRTYMDKDVQIRGHKRYRVQPGVIQGPAPLRRNDGTVNEDVGSTFRPLPSGTVFRGKLRVHNLRPAELGAVLWALDFGDASCRHMLGMARPLGYGRSRFQIAGADLTVNGPANGPAPAPTDLLAAARAAYADAMEQSCADAKVPGGWARSRVVQELQALAREIPADSPHRRHMSIAHMAPGGGKVNQFNEAKKSAGALPSALADEDWARAAGVAVPTAAPPRPAPAPAPGARAPVAPRGSARGDPRGAPPAPPPRHEGWRPVPAGSRVQATLVATNKKGNWTCALSGPDAQGRDTAGVITGAPPADAQPGQKVQVTVKTGGNPRELVLVWEGGK